MSKTITEGYSAESSSKRSASAKLVLLNNTSVGSSLFNNIAAVSVFLAHASRQLVEAPHKCNSPVLRQLT